MDLIRMTAACAAMAPQNKLLYTSWSEMLLLKSLSEGMHWSGNDMHLLINKSLFPS